MKSDPSILTQADVRRLTVKNGAGLKDQQPLIVEMLTTAVDPRTDDKLITAMFRSRLIDVSVTDFRRVVGYVQHDQYHRYPVDTHLLQAIRELKRVHTRPTLLGRLKPIVNGLGAQDWKILGWAALYHDVGKGSGGDHSDQSVRIARKDLAKFGVEVAVIEEVLWLIERHLDLSQAAFRGNSASPKIWRELHEKGVEGARLRRLAIFTAIDIRATNREAYTPWKERLLAELVERLERPEAKNLKLLHDKLEAKHGGVLERLDPFLVGALSPLKLSRDLSECLQRKDTAVSVACFKQPRTGRFWIRFHERNDRPGLFVTYARAL
ncbi:MAG: HD domain-containing protein [Bdellovibrionales bacterium]|nr:HD domain-containing protein [Bdellovibrionales bacterium]